MAQEPKGTTIVVTDAERLDVHNSLLLAAHLDAAFNAGLITFEMDGSLVVSPALADEDNDRLGLPGLLPLQGLGPHHEPYLACHRNVVFQAAIND